MRKFFGPDRRSHVAAVVIYGLLCQAVFAPIATAVLLAAATPAEAAVSGLRTIVVCSGMGLARITLDDAGNPVDEPNQGPQQTCLHCPAHTACLVPPAATAVTLRAPAAAPLPPVRPRDVGPAAGSVRQGPHPVRGPPLLRI